MLPVHQHCVDTGCHLDNLLRAMINRDCWCDSQSCRGLKKVSIDVFTPFCHNVATSFWRCGSGSLELKKKKKNF